MALSMKNLNCEMFDMTFQFDEKQFKRKEFVLDVKTKNKKEDDFFYFYGSKNKSRKEHAHLHLVLKKQESYLKLVYHTGETQSPDVREPYLEDVTKWIANFFTENELSAFITVVYKFNQQYKPTIALRYPLPVDNDLFKSALISGYEIDFPKESILHKAIISTSPKSTLVILNTKVQINLSEFDFYKTMGAFSQFPSALVQKREKDNGKGTKNRKPTRN